MIGGATDAGIGILIERDEETEGDLVFEDLDTFRIALVVEERDGLADEADGSLEIAAFEGDGAIFCHLAVNGGAEIVAKVLGRRTHETDLCEVTIEWRLACGRVDTSVILAVEPFDKEFVEPLEGESFRKGREQLGPDGEEKSLNLAATLGHVRSGVKERDTEASAGIGESIRAKSGAIVQVELTREPAFLERRDEAIAVALEVLRKIEPGVGDEPGMVVDHSEEVGLPEFPVDDDERAVHAVGLPEIVDEFGLEAAAIFGEAGVLFEAVALEEPIEAVFRRPLVRKGKGSYVRWRASRIRAD